MILMNHKIHQSRPRYAGFC